MITARYGSNCLILLAFCEEDPPFTAGFPHKGQVTRSYDVLLLACTSFFWWTYSQLLVIWDNMSSCDVTNDIWFLYQYDSNSQLDFFIGISAPFIIIQNGNRSLLLPFADGKSLLLKYNVLQYNVICIIYSNVLIASRSWCHVWWCGPHQRGLRTNCLDHHRRALRPHRRRQGAV